MNTKLSNKTKNNFEEDFLGLRIITILEKLWKM